MTNQNVESVTNDFAPYCAYANGRLYSGIPKLRPCKHESPPWWWYLPPSIRRARRASPAKPVVDRTTAAPKVAKPNTNDSAISHVVEALMNLGEKAGRAQTLVKTVYDPGMSEGQLLSAALRRR